MEALSKLAMERRMAASGHQQAHPSRRFVCRLAPTGRRLQRASFYSQTLTLLLFALTLRCNGALHVEGLIHSEAKIKFSPPIETKLTTRFAVTTDNCKWSIRTERPQSNGSTLITEAGSDDPSRVFAVAYIRKPDGTLVTRAGIVRPGPIPHISEEPIVRILWLAFASSCYFSNRSSDQMLDPLFSPQSPRLLDLDYQMPGSWQISDQTPFLPNMVVYFSDGIMRQWAEQRDSWVKPPQMTAMPKPYDHGFTNHIYNVGKSVRIGAHVLPEQFTFNSYDRKSVGVDSNDLFLISEFIGIATNVHIIASPTTFLPNLPSAASVREERFVRSSPPVHTFFYPSRGAWLSDSEVTNMPQFASQVVKQSQQIAKIAARPATRPTPRTIPRAVLWGALTLITLVPLFVGWWLSQTKHKGTK